MNKSLVMHEVEWESVWPDGYVVARCRHSPQAQFFATLRISMPPAASSSWTYRDWMFLCWEVDCLRT